MEIILNRDWHEVLGELEPRELSQVNAAMVRYQKTPNHRSLNLEQLKGRPGQKRLWTIRASQELRVLLVRQGDVTIFLRAGHHDDIYKFAQRRAFVVPIKGAPGLIQIAAESAFEEAESPSRPITARTGSGAPAADSPSILQHWEHSELLQAGSAQAISTSCVKPT